MQQSQKSRETAKRRQKEGIWRLSKQVAPLRMTRVPARLEEYRAFTIWSLVSDRLKQRETESKMKQMIAEKGNQSFHQYFLCVASVSAIARAPFDPV